MIALWLSVRVGLGSALLGLPLALVLGHLLARKRFVGKSLLTTAIMLPLVMPPVVTGYVLLIVFGTQGVLGGLWRSLGVQIPFSLFGATLAALVVGLPLYVASVRAAIEAVDVRYEEVAQSLGLGPWQTWRRVTLPLALPGIAAGFVLTFARSLGEFGATAVLAGNIEGETRTMALAIYSLLDAPNGEEAAAPLVWLSIALSFAALLGYEALVRRQRARL